MTRRRHRSQRGLGILARIVLIATAWAFVLVGHFTLYSWPCLVTLAVTVVGGLGIVFDVAGRIGAWRERRRLVRERWARVLRILEDSRAEVLAEADALADKFRRSVS